VKTNLITLILTCFLTIFTLSCGSLIKKNYSLYENDTEKISIQYPANWEKRVQEADYPFFMALSPFEDDQDNFRENVNIVTEPAAGYTLEKYYQANLLSMKNILQDFKILLEGTAVINNNPAKWLIYNHTYNNNIIKVKAYFFHNGQNGIVFTATANPASFKKYEAVFDEIVSTLRFK
jgi:hypothetical protein